MVQNLRVIGGGGGGVNLSNGMWHGLRNDRIMRNLIYGKWRTKKKTFQQESTYASLPRYFWRQFERAIDLLVHLLLLLQSKQVKRTPQNSIHELII